MKDRQLVKYIVFAFVIAWPIMILGSILGLRGNLVAFQLITMLAMFAPAAAVLIARVPLREIGWRPRIRGKNILIYLAAWLVPALLTLLGASLFYALFPQAFSSEGAYLSAVSGMDTGVLLAQQGISLRAYLILSAVMSVVAAPFLNILPSLGEELGWRGVMYPRLRARFGDRLGRLIGGAIWGVWHWPLMLIAGYEYGLEYWGSPVLGPLLFCVIICAMGILLDLAAEKSGSIWPAALGHGAINAVASLPMLFLDPAKAPDMTVGPTMVGVIGGLPMLILATVLFFRFGKKRERVEEA